MSLFEDYDRRMLCPSCGQPMAIDEDKPFDKELVHERLVCVQCGKVRWRKAEPLSRPKRPTPWTYRSPGCTGPFQVLDGNQRGHVKVSYMRWDMPHVEWVPESMLPGLARLLGEEKP